MAKVQGHAPNGSRDQQSMVHVQLLGEDGYKDTLDHSTESTPFIPHPFAIFRRTHKKTPGLVFLHLFF